MKLSIPLKEFSYKAGSHIRVRDAAPPEGFYLVSEGELELVSALGISRTLKPGDFFSVISAMTRRPELEVVRAKTDVKIYLVTRDDFVKLVKQHPELALRIIRYFSSILRLYDEALSKLVGKKETEPQDLEKLYTIAEYYNKNKRYSLAAYAYHKYIMYNPEGKHINEAKKKLKAIIPYAKNALNPQNNPNSPDKTFYDNTFIFCEGEPGEELYILLEGKVKITKLSNDKELIIAILDKGDIFGEMAIIDKKPRSASAIAHGFVKTKAIREETFPALFKSSDIMAMKLLERLSERVWYVYRQVQNLRIDDPVGRLVDLLVIQIQAKRIPIRNVPYEFEIGPEELIKMAGFNWPEDKKYIDQLLNSQKKIYEISPSGKIMVRSIEELIKDRNFYVEMSERRRRKAKKD